MLEGDYVSLETRSQYPAIRNISTMEKRRMVAGVIEEHERLPPQMARINMSEHDVFIRKSNHMGEALAKEMIKWWCHLSLAERTVMEIKFDLSLKRAWNGSRDHRCIGLLGAAAHGQENKAG